MSDPAIKARGGLKMRRVIVRRRIKRIVVKGNEKRIQPLDKEKLEKFNPPVLGLGNIGAPSREVEAIAAVFDLSRFTSFCNQVDPHLAVPQYLSRFLEWLFTEVKQGIISKSYRDGTEIWAEVGLPFMAKFLGDGVLFLWDTDGMQENAICNLVLDLRNICLKYRREFYPNIKSVVVKPPVILRCGIARGKVFSVGNQHDYVGACINIASRLQKLSRLTFCVSRRGFDFDKYLQGEERQRFNTKSVPIRGIENNELIWILKQEFDALPDGAKRLFGEP